MPMPMPIHDAEAKAVGLICATLADESFGTGPLAELRRLDPSSPAPGAPALYRLLARLPEDLLRGRDMDRWVLLTHLLALAAPERHRGHEKLGRALFAAAYSEGRLTRLLEAREDQFATVLPRMVRFLAAKGEALPPYELARLVLSGGAEAARRQIAREYYRAEAAHAAAA